MKSSLFYHKIYKSAIDAIGYRFKHVKNAHSIYSIYHCAEQPLKRNLVQGVVAIMKKILLYSPYRFMLIFFMSISGTFLICTKIVILITEILGQ